MVLLEWFGEWIGGEEVYRKRIDKMMNNGINFLMVSPFGKRINKYCVVYSEGDEIGSMVLD
ncbi:hypothetical protein [Staphylococcus epidermidis]|uniref:hypothetical protein n=1 Tax=Staphylococcus epidermidis TaxID=1282 RepID=UPI0011A8CD3D|nr:hypothetical protein [Staphylococcus epidermidis]